MTKERQQEKHISFSVDHCRYGQKFTTGSFYDCADNIGHAHTGEVGVNMYCKKAVRKQQEFWTLDFYTHDDA